jgi:hypothetical protein
VACEVAFREICHCAARSPNQFEFDFLSQGYHDNPLVGIERIQEHLDVADAGRFDAILVGYGLCNNMLNGLRAPEATKLVIPRAHDCITFFLGDKERYREHFLDHPGTYYFTTGWLEHRQRGGERPERKQGAGLGVQMQYETLVEKYGEENARYLLDVMDGWTSHYERGVFIDFEFSHDLPHRETARQLCQERGWNYEEVAGDLSLFQRWLDGDWPAEDYLTVPAGTTVLPSYDDGVIHIEPVPETAEAT